MTDNDDFTVDDVLNAYRHGFFPMADSADTEDIYWYDPPLRGQLSIHSLHVPKRLKQTILSFPFDIRLNYDFTKTIDLCSEPTKDRPQTWINPKIRDLFIALHKKGYAHSIECWDNETLVGGLYGLAIGGLFCGESMFSRQRDASKIALIHLCARLWKGGFKILDTQFINDHLKQFGAYEITRETYKTELSRICALSTDFMLEKHPDLPEEKLVESYINMVTD